MSILQYYIIITIISTYYYLLSTTTTYTTTTITTTTNILTTVTNYHYLAWNDFDAIPRSASTFGLTDHGGSRKRLLFSRREVQRNEVDSILSNTMNNKTNKLFPNVNYRRVNMITDPAVENS